MWGCGQKSEQAGDSLATNSITSTSVPQVLSSSTPESFDLLHVIRGHDDSILDVEFSAQGKILASSSRDRNIKVWDVQSGEEIHAFHINSVDMADIDISISRNLLASGEAIWDLGSLQEIHVLERGSVNPGFVSFSPDGLILALGVYDQQITLWDVMNGLPITTFENQEEKRTKRIEFSPDGSLLAVGVHNGSVWLLDAASGEVVKILQYGGETDIHDLAFSPDGKILATGGRLPLVILWDVASGEVTRTFRLTDNAISMDFSPDGRILASAGGYEHEVLLWDVETGGRLHALPHNNQVSSIAFSPDGKLLAVGCVDNTIYLWGISTNLLDE